jgi:type IX secretion system substrate protein
VNKVNPLVEGGIIQGTYGGNNASDNSGVIKYTRIEYPGYRYQLNNEVNGLTMGGVGSGTEIHHVQVSESFDDAFEWFGGTVNPHHLICLGTTDDEIDTDFGFSGKLQFVFTLRDLNFWDPTGESNGFESDNDASATSTDQPYTTAVISNATFVGPERTDALVGTLPPPHHFQYSVVLRRSTKESIFNSVVLGYPWGVSLRDATTQNWANTNELEMKNVSITASLIPTGSTSVHDQVRWANVATWFNTAGFNNIGSSPRNPSAVNLTDLSSITNPNPVPAAGSELIGSASFASAKLAGLQVVTYRGAFDPNVPIANQWIRCWSNFDPDSFWNPVTDIADQVQVAPRAGQLEQNVPNPFNPRTAIRFKIPTQGHVSLKVYNARGEEVATVVDHPMPAGAYERSVDMSGLPSGTYMYHLTAPGVEYSRKMQLVK